MLPNSSPQVKSVSFAIGDPDDKLSIAYAMKEGYKIALDSDGCAEILKADGTAYHVVDFECDCPDKQGRGGSYAGHCKHEVWTSQLRPCELCNGIMALGEYKTAFGQTVKRFECQACGNARDFGLVKAERRVHRHAETNICRRAIKKFKATMDADQVYGLLRQRPDLAETMEQELRAANMAYIADHVAHDGKHRQSAQVTAQAAD